MEFNGKERHAGTLARGGFIVRTPLYRALAVSVPRRWRWKVRAPAAARARPTLPRPRSRRCVVTVEKRFPEALQDVPMSRQPPFLRCATLDKLQETKFEDFAATVPGLVGFRTRRRGSPASACAARTAAATARRWLSISTNLPIGSSNALLNGAVLTGDLDTWDMQRIEVLRGPQSTPSMGGQQRRGSDQVRHHAASAGRLLRSSRGQRRERRPWPGRLGGARYGQRPGGEPVRPARRRLLPDHSGVHRRPTARRDRDQSWVQGRLPRLAPHRADRKRHPPADCVRPGG